MNPISQSRQSPRLVKIQLPYSLPATQTTPKKQCQELKAQLTDEQSTLQKQFSFESKIKIQTVRKDKKKPKRPWTPEEDLLLKELVLTKGPKQWAFISSFFNERCGKQCRQRWHNHLRNGIKKGDWTHLQEWLLFLGVHAFGKRWSIISKFLEGRTENTLKNHWNCKMKPKKQNLSRKLARVLITDSTSIRYLQKNELNLIRLIKERSSREEEDLLSESQSTQRIVKLFKGVINNFLQFKKQNYESLETETKMEEVKVEEDVSVEMSMLQDYSKKQSFHKEEEKARELKLQILAIENELFENHTFGLINDFGSDSNSLNIKMIGLMKEVSERNGEQLDEAESQGFEMEESEWDESVKTRRKGRNGESQRFGSPLRRNIFEGMDLEESNKKRVFESAEKGKLY